LTESQNSLFGAKRLGLSRKVGLADFQVKPNLGWIFLHGCKLRLLVNNPSKEITPKSSEIS